MTFDDSVLIWDETILIWDDSIFNPVYLHRLDFIFDFVSHEIVKVLVFEVCVKVVRDKGAASEGYIPAKKGY